MSQEQEEQEVITVSVDRKLQFAICAIVDQVCFNVPLDENSGINESIQNVVDLLDECRRLRDATTFATNPLSVVHVDISKQLQLDICKVLDLANESCREELEASEKSDLHDPIKNVVDLLTRCRLKRKVISPWVHEDCLELVRNLADMNCNATISDGILTLDDGTQIDLNETANKEQNS